MKILDLFSGIGGFSLGFESANYENYDFTKFPHDQDNKSDQFFKTIAFCEIDTNCHKVLNRHYSNVPIYEDITKLSKIKEVDIITGGFPCQDLSLAGKQDGLKGKRSGLFYEMCRVIKESKPKYVLFENTPELIRNKTYYKLFSQELRLLGYKYRAFLLRADAYGYKHKRQRAYIIAHTNEIRQPNFEKIFDFLSDESSQPKTTPSKEIISIHNRCLWRRKIGYENNIRDIRRDDGFSENVERVGMLGNAVIPQIVSGFARFIKHIEKDRK